MLREAPLFASAEKHEEEGVREEISPKKRLILGLNAYFLGEAAHLHKKWAT
jgi:hypothetical protein